MSLLSRRIASVASILLIGEGVLSMVKPSTYPGLFRGTNEPVDAAAKTFARNPEVTFGIGLVEVLVGFWLATRLDD